MPVSVTLPALGESVTEGTVTRWLKQPGDTVEVDEPLLEVSTDKVDTEIPSPTAGTLLEVKVSEDETVEVGAELAVIGDAADAGGAAGDGQQAGAATNADESSGEPSGSDQAGSTTQVEEAPAQSAAPAEAPAPQAQQEQPAGSGSGDDRSSGGDDGASVTSVTLPALGESVTEGTVTRWLKQPGDAVEVDEPLLEVSTDKVDTEIPSPVAGVLREIKVAEDETVEVGAELATIGAERGSTPSPEATSPDTAQQAAAPEAAGPSETAPAEAAPSETAPAEAAPARSEQQPADATTAPGQGVTPEGDQEESTQDEKEQARTAAVQRQEAPAPAPTPGQGPAPSGARPPSSDGAAYVTPLVRKLAAEHGVDLSSLSGSGVGGRIRKQDVLDAANRHRAAAEAPSGAPAPAAPSEAPAPPAPSPLRGKTEKMSRLRKVIATRMVESLQTAAQLTTVLEVDVTAIARLRERKKEDFAQREGVKLSFTPFFAKAVVDSLKGHPKLNATIDVDKGEITYYDAEHLGMAVDTERGLLVATVKDAGDLSIAGLARKIADLGQRTRDNKVTPDELSGATFTLTNTGSRGALFDTPIIFQPQVAILGTGAVVKRPVVIDDPNLGETIAVRHMAYLALTYDHRLVDGADAARFLTEVKRRLETGHFDV
ncbi:MAG: 2-oxoglutarate dehydrogenase, E2 component, dihydrolipoamide succinyltransferase [Nocardioidaceae bacterium]